MWRAFFCAIGLMLLILGIECLLIDNATLASGVVDDPIQATPGFYTNPTVAMGTRIFKPAEWMPWSCLACGAVVLLYALTLNRRWGEGG